MKNEIIRKKKPKRVNKVVVVKMAEEKNDLYMTLTDFIV